MRFVKDRFANNEQKVGSRCPDFDLLDGFGIADGYSPPSLVYVLLGAFLAGYENACPTTKDPEMTHVLLFFRPRLFWND